MKLIVVLLAALMLTGCNTGVHHVPSGTTSDAPPTTEVRTDFPNGGS